MKRSGYVYMCSGGETHDSIAREVWGDEKYAAELHTMNPEYDRMMMFLGGEALYLPVIDLPATEDAAAAVAGPEKAPWRD